MREECPVAYSELLHWSVFRYEDVVRILHDHETFSNAVSRHLSVPNGMDPPQHTPYRRMIDKYFTPAVLAPFETVFRDISSHLIDKAVSQDEIDAMEVLGRPFAGRVQCAFMGWPEDLSNPLITWTQKNYRATLAQDRAEMGQIACEFQQLIYGMLDRRLAAGLQSADDITARLLNEEVNGRKLTREEIASILRNWTVGEIGTIAASIGIIVQFLAENQELQLRLREDYSLIDAANDEILRLHGPLVASRRVTTRPVEIGGRLIDKGERITLIWVAANRDGRVFEDPYNFSFDRDPNLNLLYGAGIHVCPGAPLARMELRVFVEELLRRTDEIQPAPANTPKYALYPASGYSSVPVVLK